ncbi:MAG: hypothetical protein GX095_02870 [Clostridiales bacterium]|mgnify:CR=1 FL=1|jgi:hypothetical protein|nr:hypothetical protein [Clostridiales bacterium]HOB63912.1 hypothetical protein [Clostridia bacterium]HOK81146.1 hypothetical protein [Clostridia bacterium]HOL60265.1 hypothetical protein [Clostridia bacterium]HPO53798.1 hypothetical protein [Clostridia bacterium]
MTIFRLKHEFTPRDTSGHFRFPFNIDKECRRLTIKYKYSPKTLEDSEYSLRLIDECFRRYGIEASEERKAAELPLNNLITISLDSPEGLVGTAHRHLNDARYEISESYSSAGFFPAKITAGEWAVTLSAHAVLSQKVIAEVEVSVD